MNLINEFEKVYKEYPGFKDSYLNKVRDTNYYQDAITQTLYIMYCEGYCKGCKTDLQRL